MEGWQEDGKRGRCAIRVIGPEMQEAGYDVVGQTKAGLLNHVQQRHARMARVMEKCPFCKERFCKQELPMQVGSVRCI